MKKLTTLFLGLLFLGSVGQAEEALLEKYHDIGDYQVTFVKTITSNCGQPFWVQTSGCTWTEYQGEKQVSVKKIEVRNHIFKRPGDKSYTQEFVLIHEIGHAQGCGKDEKCADDFARKTIEAKNNAKRFRIENKVL